MMLTGVREAHAPSTPASLGATRRKSDEYQLRTIFGSCTKRLLMFALRRLWGLRDIDQRRRFMNTRPNPSRYTSRVVPLTSWAIATTNAPFGAFQCEYRIFRQHPR